jgi:enoyl-CoA hydratase/3-hydroxyacyl-CoA dehydrogenase
MEFEDIENVTVVGAGHMGHGIAELAALAGYEVHLRDIEEDLVQDGYAAIEASLEKLAEKGQIGTDERDEALDRIAPVVDLTTAASDADIVIEAIVERMDVKKDVYEQLDETAPDEAIFASNTSSLSVTELSAVTDRSGQFCGMHFFNPPVLMDLVEVISGEHTAEETVETVEKLAAAMDKTPVRVRSDEPGFVVNRILVPLMNEACWLVETDEATMAEVDATVKYDVGLPMGAFELGDQVGNDITLDVLRYMHAELGDAYQPCPLLERTVETGNLGQKTGQGFYDYENGGVDVPVDETRDDLRRRLLAVMANETGKLVENGVAPPADIDRAVKLGGGFPDGPARMADDAGLDTLVETLETAHEATSAARYEISAGLHEAADDGGFHDDSGGEAGEPAGREFEAIRFEHPRENVAEIVLDRPHQMNTITPQLLEEFEAVVDSLQDADETRAVVVSGAGDRAFSAGANATSMATSDRPLNLLAVELSRQGQSTFGSLESLPMPVVAAIDGYTLGGGMELAACADLRVASERSTFGQPEHDLGIMPGWGGTQRLKEIVGEGRAKEIIFTADHYEPETMADYGFVNDVVPDDELRDTALDLAADLARGPPLAQEYTKKAFLAGRDDTTAGMEVEAQAFGHLVGSDDFMEGVSKMQSDDSPEFEGR